MESKEIELNPMLPLDLSIFHEHVKQSFGHILDKVIFLILAGR